MRHATNASGNPIAHSKRQGSFEPARSRRHLGQVSWLRAGWSAFPGSLPVARGHPLRRAPHPYTVAGPLPIFTAFPDIASLGGGGRCPAFADPKASETYGNLSDFSIHFSSAHPKGLSTDHNILCLVVAFLPRLGACSIHAGAWILTSPLREIGAIQENREVRWEGLRSRFRRGPATVTGDPPAASTGAERRPGRSREGLDPGAGRPACVQERVPTGLRNRRVRRVPSTAKADRDPRRSTAPGGASCLFPTRNQAELLP